SAPMATQPHRMQTHRCWTVKAASCSRDRFSARQASARASCGGLPRTRACSSRSFPGDRLEAPGSSDERRAQHTRRVAEHVRDDGCPEFVMEDQGRNALNAFVVEEVEVRDAAAEDDAAWIEDIDDVGEAAPERLEETVDRLGRVRITGAPCGDRRKGP